MDCPLCLTFPSSSSSFLCLHFSKMLALASSKSLFISLFLLIALAHDDTLIKNRPPACDRPLCSMADSSWQLNGNAHCMPDHLFLDGSHSKAVALFSKSSFSLSEDLTFHWNFTFNTLQRGNLSFIIVVSELDVNNPTQIIVSIELSAACAELSGGCPVDFLPTSRPADCNEQKNRPLQICGLSNCSSDPAPQHQPAAVISLHDLLQADEVFTHTIPLDALDPLLAPLNTQTLYAGFMADAGATINVTEWCFAKTNESLGGYSPGSASPCPNVSVKTSKRPTVLFWVVGTLVAFSMLMGLAAVFIICTKKRRRRRPDLLQAARPPSARPPTITSQPPQVPPRARSSQESSATPIMSAPSSVLHVDPKDFEVTGTASWLPKTNPR